MELNKWLQEAYCPRLYRLGLLCCPVATTFTGTCLFAKHVAKTTHAGAALKAYFAERGTAFAYRCFFAAFLILDSKAEFWTGAFSS